MEKILLYYYIDGKTWSKNVSAVADLLNHVRKHKPLKGLRVLISSPSQVKESCLEIISRLKSSHKNDLIYMCPDVSISNIEPVLLHTDVVPGNLILGDEGLRLIDWQCPAIGDPIVDIMMFLSPGMHENLWFRKTFCERS